MNTNEIAKNALDLVLKYKDRKDATLKQVAARFARDNNIDVELALNIIKGTLVAVGIIDAAKKKEAVQPYYKGTQQTS